MFKFLDKLLSGRIPVQGHIRDDMWLLDDGSVYAMLEVFGRPWETSEALDEWKSHLNRVWKNAASDTVIVNIYDCRGHADPSVLPDGSWRTDLSSSLDANYRSSILSRGLFSNRIFLGIQIRPQRYGGEFISEQIEIRRTKPVEEAPEDRVQKLHDICALIKMELKAYRPRQLGQRIHNNIVFSEIAEALVFAMTGLWRPIGMTTGRMGEALFSEHIVIKREMIEFVGPGRSWFGSMFGMKHFPAQTLPGMLRKLLASSYRRTIYQSFRFVQTADMQTIMNRKHHRLLTAEDASQDQAEKLKRAAQELPQSDWVYGDYSFSMLAFADSEDEMVNVATDAWSDLAESGMIVSRETKALEAAFYSMVPGNMRLRPRPGYISSVNLASLAPMHAYPMGEERGYWGQPAALFITGGRTPYKYHFHVGDVGNTFICGRTGSGKSVMIGFLIAMAEKYDATVIVFDVSRGLKMLCKMLGGSYSELRNDLAPLKALTDSEDDRSFLTTLIRGCIMADDGERLTPEEDRRLHLALKIVMALPVEDRSLSEVRAFLGADVNGAGARLDKWCRGNELGWILDNDTDTIRLDGKVIGFDQTHILDDANARGPVVATLYHYAGKLIDGRKLLFVIDEFWKSLLDPAFRALVQHNLRTLRKMNSPMILATQSPRDALVSEIKHVIRDQCPSQFYFANGQASWDDFGEQGMGLTRTELEIVRSLVPGTGEFLLKQGSISTRLQLPLGSMERELAIMSGREETTRLFDAVDDGDGPETVAAAFHAARKRELV